MSISRVAVSVLAAALLVSTAEAQKVWTVGPFISSGVDDTQIYTAVLHAAPGDIVLVRSGTYHSFKIHDKGVSVVREPGATVIVESDGIHAAEVKHVPAGQQVLLFGLNFTGSSLVPSVQIFGNDGSVVLDQCTGVGGWPAVEVTLSPAVTLSDCNFTGSNSGFFGGPPLWYVAGGALGIHSSVVAVQGGQFRGGNGVDAPATLNQNPGAKPGATAVIVESGLAFFGDCTLTGGDGGDASCTQAQVLEAAPGGSGLVLSSGVPVVTWNNVVTVSGASGAPSALCPVGPPAPPATVVQTGSLTQLFGVAPNLAVTSPVREGKLAKATLTGLPGSPVALLLSLTSTVVPNNSRSGALVVGGAPFLQAIGALPASGSLLLQNVIPELGPGIEGLTLYLQPAAYDAGVGHFVLGEMASLALIDSSI